MPEDTSPELGQPSYPPPSALQSPPYLNPEPPVSPLEISVRPRMSVHVLGTQ